jgi:hypothetical protein
MTQYAQVTNNEITRINVQLPAVIDGVSIPAGATGLEQFNLYPITGNEPSYDRDTQRLSGPRYEFDGAAIQRVYTVEDLTAEEIRQRDVPQVVTIRQAKLALLQADLLDNIEAAMTQADRATQIEWEYATEFKRDWPALITMQPLLGLTDEQVDDLFKLAVTL